MEALGREGSGGKAVQGEGGGRLEEGLDVCV